MPWKEHEEPADDEKCPTCGKVAEGGNSIVTIGKDGLYYRSHQKCPNAPGEKAAVSSSDKAAKR